MILVADIIIVRSRRLQRSVTPTRYVDSVEPWITPHEYRKATVWTYTHRALFACVVVWRSDIM